MYYAILFFALASSFWMGRIGDTIRVPKEIACVTGLLSISLFPSRKRAFKNFWIKGFTFWAFILTVLFVKDRICFYELLYVFIAFLAIQAIASSESFLPDISPLKYFNVISADSIEDEMKGILRFVCWMAVFMSAYVFIQALALDSRYTVKGYLCPGIGPFTHRIIGTLGNPSLLGSWYAMTLPAFFLQKDRKFTFLFIFCFIALCLTGSTIGIGGTLFAILIILFYKSKKRFAGLLVLMLIAGSFLFFHPSFKDYINPEGRIKAWKIVYNIWTKGYGDIDYSEKLRLKIPPDLQAKSLYGFGPGLFRFIIPQFTQDYQVVTDNPWNEAHNEPFEIAFNYGVIGLIFYLGFCFTIIWKFFIQPKSELKIVLFGILFGFFVSSMGIFLMHIGATAYLAVIYAGFLMNLQEGKYEKVEGFRNFVRRIFGLCRCSRCYPV